MTNLLRYMKEKSNYNTKEEAVEFLGNETNFTYEECSKANDFHIRLNKKINIQFQFVGYSEIRFVKTPEKVWQRILIKFLK